MGEYDEMKPVQKNECKIKKIQKIDVERYEIMERVMKALSNKTSLAVVEAILKNGEACACELEPALGVTQPVVTNYLRRLYIAGILRKREQWRYTFYSVSEDIKDMLSDLFSLVGFNDRK